MAMQPLAPVLLHLALLLYAHCPTHCTVAHLGTTLPPSSVFFPALAGPSLMILLAALFGGFPCCAVLSFILGLSSESMVEVLERSDPQDPSALF